VELYLATFLLLQVVAEAVTIRAAAVAQVDYLVLHHNHYHQLITQ
jgi:hypothetical protein